VRVDVARKLNSEDVLERLTDLFVHRGVPRHIRSDNGSEFTAKQVAALYGVRWDVEVLFRELKSLYGLDEINTSDPVIVELLVIAALLTLTVSRALLGVLQEMHPEMTFPQERWAATFRSLAQLIFEELAQSLGHPPPNLTELLFRNARQPEKLRLTLTERVTEALRTEVQP